MNEQRKRVLKDKRSTYQPGVEFIKNIQGLWLKSKMSTNMKQQCCDAMNKECMTMAASYNPLRKATDGSIGIHHQHLPAMLHNRFDLTMKR